MKTRGTHRPAASVIVLVAGLVLLPVATWWTTRGGPAWRTMWAIAIAEFFALKLFTLHDAVGEARNWRVAAYIGLWPGLNAREFLRERGVRPEWARGGVLVGSLASVGFGAALFWWATWHVSTAPPPVVGWAGMIGLIFMLHFGAFRLLAWAWCRAGVDAPPIMRTPVAATSVAEFWGERWNVAFAETARRFLFRPLARRAGAKVAGAAVFLVSGLVHESVLSLPARGGWGGPTLYFALQAIGIAAEKSVVGRGIGLGSGWRGWFWMVCVTGAPVPLLFHTPFVERVIVPFVQEISSLLP